jgi:hypothetical protein
MREKIFREMDDSWLAAYEAGVFTEFMEQRSPGHTVLDNKIYRKGMLEFQRDIQHSLDSLDYLNDPQAYAKREELKAMLICADAIDPLRRATRGKGTGPGGEGTRPAAQGRVGVDRRGLFARPGTSPARFLGGAAILLVRAPGRDHGDEPVGLLLSRPAGPAPVPVLQRGNWTRGR